ncbi:hypothetical protein [Deinococcus budaensis]|uniref:Uncharacterized protein n=1 Tax=Deinococcus budaensis TaxID=1665626 RepID=A0A7W8LRT6_9DEIO|nr:hypothetical protein [Deinococcus budaensis]MBB5235985.1 hypothetical protein [Deinococcus budaensis]
MLKGSRVEGMDTDTRYGVFGSFQLWEGLALLAAIILPMSIASNYRLPFFLTLLAPLVGFMVTLFVIFYLRNIEDHEPRKFDTWYGWYTGPDYYEVRPDPHPVPVTRRPSEL